MIRVYLCDDEQTWLEQLNKSIVDYQIKSDWELTMGYQSTSPVELLRMLSEDTPVGGIYFLDIDFKTTINGLELAKQIRELDSQASIIFITTHDEMVMETFRLKLAVLDYIIKDTSSLTCQVHQCLEHIERNYLNKNQTNFSSITIRMASSFYTIHQNDIYYIESIKNTHKICLHLKSTLYHYSDTLASMRARLGNDFVQCHKGCLVNIRHIKELNRNNFQVILDNNESCFCSVREWKHLVKKYHTIHDI